MSVIPLSPADLLIASSLVVILAGLSLKLELGLGRQIIVSGLRMTVQLLIVGFVLHWLFDNVNPIFVLCIALMMLFAAAFEVSSRQKRRLKGFWSFGTGLAAMFASSFSIIILTLTVIIRADPWYSPQYAIPMLGMLLGNTMTGVALGMSSLSTTLWSDKKIVEQRLALGQTWMEAVHEIRRESMRLGMIPIINSMAATGLVSLPGMMTGQILGGSPALEAVKYQILIMFLIASGTGFGVMVSVYGLSGRFFDSRHRLHLEVFEPSSS